MPAIAMLLVSVCRVIRCCGLKCWWIGARWRPFWAFKIWVRYSEPIPTSLSLVGLACWIWGQLAFHISGWICNRKLWTQGVLAHPELILESASLRTWIWGQTPCRLHPNWLHNRGSQPPEFSIGTFWLCNRGRIAIAVAAVFGCGLRTPSHWSRRLVYHHGNRWWSRQYKAVDNWQCKPVKWLVHSSTQRVQLGIRTDQSRFGMPSWTRHLLGFCQGGSGSEGPG